MSGGVSNVSFSFRGNDPVREAIHTVFLYHAIQAGMDMGIVNAGMVGVYDDLEPVLRERVEDVVLNRRPSTSRRAELTPATPDRSRRNRQERRQGRQQAERMARHCAGARQRLSHALVHGITEFIVDDTEEVPTRRSWPRAAGRCT